MTQRVSYTEGICSFGMYQSAARLLVYKFFPHSGDPKYFETFLKPRYSVYRTRRSQSDGVLLQVPHFASIYKPKTHLGFSFAYDAPRIWNDLPDGVRSVNHPLHQGGI